MAYKRLNLATGDLLDQDVFKHLEDGIEAIDLALDSKVVEVEKIHYGTNRFDKNKFSFAKNFYQDINLADDFKYTKKTAATSAGGGWYDIPVEAGKTYIFAIRNPLTINYNGKDITYGIFNALFFVDNTDTIITNVSTNGLNYYTKYGGQYGAPELNNVQYSTKKVKCDSYTSPGHKKYGMGTSMIKFTVYDESIDRVHVQIGSNEFSNPTYQIDSEFAVTRGYLTDDEIQTLQDSFQINEGNTLLDYEEFNDYLYIDKVTESNLTKLQSAFTLIPVPSSNLFDPVNYIVNHAYISSTGLSTTNPGAPSTPTYGRSCLIKIPVEKKSYVLHLTETVTIGNKDFCTFGHYLLLDKDDKIICGSYPFSNSELRAQIQPDTTKGHVSGMGTETLKFSIYSDDVKYILFPVLDSDKNVYGLWQNYEKSIGLTDEESLELFSKIQLNDKGYTILPYESFYDVTYKSVIGPENIQGLDTFIEDTNKKIEESLSNIKVTGSKEPSMACQVDENDFFIRAKKFQDDLDLVWKLQKINSSGGNKYFNISSINTCKKDVQNEYISSSLSIWKGCGDDICPPSVQTGYIAANHGGACVDKLTVTNHGKTQVDIGSTWIDNTTQRTYVLTHVYNENSIGVVWYYYGDPNNNMGNGKFTYGNPSVGSTLIHQNGATNTNDMVIEERTTTQLWPCFNHYTIKFYVDGIEKDLNEVTIHEGDRFEVITQYDVIYIPAMLEYIMNNVGSVEILNPEEINECYMTMYITYQFNKNGSISTYSSFYMPMTLKIDYIGLVQSARVSDTPYTYIPDTTTYKTPVLHDCVTTITFPQSIWTSTDKAPYRYYQFADNTFGKGFIQVYDRTIGWGKNDIRLQHLGTAGRYSGAAKMYTAFISGGYVDEGTYFDGMAARVPLYKYDPDVTSVGWYWSNEDIHLMIDTHNTVNKDIVLPDYMNNMRIEILDKTDSVTCNQTYIFNNKLRFISSEYGYLVLRLYK